MMLSYPYAAMFDKLLVILELFVGIIYLALCYIACWEMWNNLIMLIIPFGKHQ